MSQFYTTNADSEKLNIASEESLPFKLHDYNDLYAIMQEITNPNKIKSTLVFLFFALLRSLKPSKFIDVIEEFVLVEDNIDMYEFLVNRCKLSKLEKDMFVDELYKMAPVLKSIFNNNKENIENLIMKNFPDVSRNKLSFFAFKNIQKAILSDELIRINTPLDTKKLLTFFLLNLDYQYLNLDHNDDYDNADLLRVYPHYVYKVLLRAIPACEEMHFELNKLKDSITVIKNDSLNKCNSILNTNIKPLNPSKIFSSAIHDLLAMLNPKIRDIYAINLQVAFEEQKLKPLFDALTNDAYLFYPLCYFIHAYDLCRQIDYLERDKSFFRHKLQKLLITKDFLEAIIFCRKLIDSIHDFLKLLWSDNLTVIKNNKDYFDGLFKALDNLCKNMYFKAMVLVHRNASLGWVKEDIVRCFEPLKKRKDTRNKLLDV